MRVQRRLFVGTVVLLAGCATYLLASAASLLQEPAGVPDPAIAAGLAEWERTAARVRPKARRRADATPIFERNPFDSVTGPLTGVPIPSFPKKKDALDLSDPLDAPRCDDIRVYSTIRFRDPSSATAVVQLKDADSSQIVKVGDELGDMQLAYIGFNQQELSPAAWFVGDQELCQSLVFSDRPRFKSAHRSKLKKRRGSRKAKARKAKRRKRKAKKKRRKKRKRRRRKGPPRLPASISRKLKHTGVGEYRIDRDVIDKLLGDGTKWLKRTKMVPVKKDGRVVGMRVSNVGRGTLLRKLGIRNGDQIRKINGFEVSNPEKALQAYARLRRASDITVELNRRGRDVTLDYSIR